MGFSCLMCGECCHHMGMVHEIKEQKGPLAFVIRNRYTGELTDVVVDPDKTDLFLDDKTTRVLPEACPFFRLDPRSKSGRCTVHLTWPDICRDFGCWKFLIKKQGGNVIGRVFPPRMLVSEDNRLNDFWDLRIRAIRNDNDQDWEDQMIAILASAGYDVIR